MLKRLTFRQKMWLLPSLAAFALLFVLGATGIMGYRIAQQLELIRVGYSPALELSRDLEEHLANLQRDLQDAVSLEEPEAVARADVNRDAFLARLGDAARNPIFAASRVAELRASFIEYHRLARDTSLKLARKSTEASLTDDVRQMTERYNAVKATLAQGTTRDQTEMDAAFESSVNAQFATRVAMAIVVVLALVFLSLVSMSIMASVTVPLGQLTQAANRIASEGTLTFDVTIESQDEVGQLARAFKAMVDKVRVVHGTLNASVQELTATAAQLKGATAAQTSALQRQAAGLAETSATAQEIKQTSSVAAAKAETVLQVTVKAEELSADGQRSVDASLQGLQAIRSQVDGMVTSVTALSGRMQLVGEIIERVKDLADQSNILALNAAIESTKAGEYGKSFAVVAREIRTLADQSLQSTARIREILGEIQEAIRSTADGTSLGVLKMQEGTEQIRASGDTLRAMMAIIEQSTQAARQIVAAVNQQNAGVAQISTAVVGLNEAMEETLGGVSRVEQSASAIGGTSADLSKLLEAFRA